MVILIPNKIISLDFSLLPLPSSHQFYQKHRAALPNQPSLKSTTDEEASASDDASWRQLRQIASVDKEEMLRLQATKSELTVETSASPTAAAGKGGGERSRGKSGVGLERVRRENGTGEETDAAGVVEDSTTPKNEGGAEEAAANKGEEGSSPGEELQSARSNLSRTSSLSNSPTDADAAVRPIIPHHNHHHHHPFVRQATGNTQGAAAAGGVEDDDSPSASTISTKASYLAVAAHHPPPGTAAAFFGGKQGHHYPAPNVMVSCLVQTTLICIWYALFSS